MMMMVMMMMTMMMMTMMVNGDDDDDNINDDDEEVEEDGDNDEGDDEGDDGDSHTLPCSYVCSCAFSDGPAVVLPPPLQSASRQKRTTGACTWCTLPLSSHRLQRSAAWQTS